MFQPQRICADVLRVFARGAPGSPQRRFRFYLAEYVQAAFGEKGPEHGLPRNLDALLDMALHSVRQDFGPSFTPMTAT